MSQLTDVRVLTYRVAGRASRGSGRGRAAARHSTGDVVACQSHRAVVYRRHHWLLRLRRRTTSQGAAESHRSVSARCSLLLAAMSFIYLSRVIIVHRHIEGHLFLDCGRTSHHRIVPRIAPLDAPRARSRSDRTLDAEEEAEESLFVVVF